MSDVSDGLQRDLGPVEGATSGCGARRELLGAALLALLFGFVLILPTARLVEDVLNLVRQAGHRSLQSSHRFPQSAFVASAQRSTGHLTRREFIAGSKSDPAIDGCISE
jgi:hypothetical protein